MYAINVLIITCFKSQEFSFGVKMNEPEQEYEDNPAPIHLSAVRDGKSADFSHLIDVYGRLRVREYNTLHRAIRRSSWGPVRCNIALHLRMETLTGYFPFKLSTVSKPGNFPQPYRWKEDNALSSTHYSVSFIYYYKLNTIVHLLICCIGKK